MRELAGVKSSQNIGFPIPRDEELVRLQDDVSRSRTDPEDDIRGVAARNERRTAKGAYLLAVETQRIPRFGRDLCPSSERIHRETCEALPALRFHHIERVVVRLQLERGRIESSRRDREGEMEGTRPHVGVGRMEQEQDDGLNARLRQDGTVLYGESRRPVDRVAAPPERPQPVPHRTRGTQRPVRGDDRIVESRDHHVNDRYNSRVFAAIRSQVKSLRTCRRPVFPIFAPVAGSSRIRVIARPSFAGSAGGTRRPVSSSTTTSLMPPTRVATTGVSHAIASRLMIPNGS